MGLLDQRFSELKGEELAGAKKSVDDAATNERTKPLSVSGKFLMKVDTIAYFNKKDEMVIFPTLSEAQKTKTLQLVVRLSVADSPAGVAKGSYTYVNIPILPAPGADGKLVANIGSMCKQYLSKLLGTETIDITDKDWIVTNLLPEFEKSGNKLKLVRDHKMKNLVMAVVEDSEYNGKVTQKVKYINAAQKGDVSIPNTAHASSEASNVPNIEPSAAAAASSSSALSDAEMSDAGLGYSEPFSDEG